MNIYEYVSGRNRQPLLFPGGLMPQLAMSRRGILVGMAAAALTPMRAFADNPTLSEDGLYQQLWFLQSFLDLGEDFRAARSIGKGFVLLWELKGCPFCRLLHSESFSNPRIAAYAKDNFAFLQLNLIGSRPVIDFDGTEHAEKSLAQRYQIAGTPTLQFFGEADGDAREVARTNYLRPAEFLGMLRFVREKGYETAPFDTWLRANPMTL